MNQKNGFPVSLYPIVSTILSWPNTVQTSVNHIFFINMGCLKDKYHSCSKTKKKCKINEEMHLKDTDKMANSVDPDQTAPEEQSDLGLH